MPAFLSSLLIIGGQYCLLAVAFAFVGDGGREESSGGGGDGERGGDGAVGVESKKKKE